jgi:hypothetical protein
VRSHDDLSLRLRHIDHRIDAVAHEIEDHLLNLDRVGLDQWRSGR